MAFTVFGSLKQHVDEIALFDRDLSGLVEELVNRHDAFRLVAHVDHNFGGSHSQDCALDDFAFSDIAEAAVVQTQQLGELGRVHVRVHRLDGGAGGIASPCESRDGLLANFGRQKPVIYIRHARARPPRS